MHRASVATLPDVRGPVTVEALIKACATLGRPAGLNTRRDMDSLYMARLIDPRVDINNIGIDGSKAISPANEL